MASLRWTWAGFCLLVGLVGAVCGGCDSLVDQSYRGEPLFGFDGKVVSFDDPSLGTAPVQVAVFWAPSGHTGDGMTSLVEQASVSVRMSFPLRFRLEVFEPPPRGVWLADGRPLALGLVLAYQDHNRDGHYSPGELIGGNESRALVYANAPIASQDSPTGAALPAGFSLAYLPLLCDLSALPPLTPDPSCAPGLGEPCLGASDCSQALTCLDQARFPDFVGGACALLVTAASCVPHGGGTLGLQTGSYYLLGCQADSECRAGWYCDLFLESCLPEIPVSIAIDAAFSVPRLCAIDLNSLER